MLIKQGLVFRCTHPRWPEHVFTYKIGRTDLDEGHGQVELFTLSIEEKHQENKVYKDGEMKMVVDKLWFNTDLTVRVLKPLLPK